jgi:hypothetical protein
MVKCLLCEKRIKKSSNYITLPEQKIRYFHDLCYSFYIEKLEKIHESMDYFGYNKLEKLKIIKELYKIENKKFWKKKELIK